LLPDPDRRRCLLGTGVWLAGGGATQLALANPVSAWPEISGHLPAATLAGSGQLRFFGLAVYRAQLWVDPGFSASTYDEHAFALTLNYQRALQGRAIAERSIQEIKRQVPIDGRARNPLAGRHGGDIPECARARSAHRSAPARQRSALLVQWACTRYAVGCKLQCPLFRHLAASGHQ
jgi:hypothetical protein